jgi:hypothetical protein
MPASSPVASPGLPGHVLAVPTPGTAAATAGTVSPQVSVVPTFPAAVAAGRPPGPVEATPALVDTGAPAATPDSEVHGTRAATGATGATRTSTRTPALGVARGGTQEATSWATVLVGLGALLVLVLIVAGFAVRARISRDLAGRWSHD